MSAQLCVSSTTNSQETGIPFARDMMVDASSVQLVGASTMASAFGGLIYEILIFLRLELAASITSFAARLVNCSMTKIGAVHQGGLQVLYKYLQEVYSSSSRVV